jgi:hypothetical protein
MTEHLTRKAVTKAHEVRDGYHSIERAAANGRRP